MLPSYIRLFASMHKRYRFEGPVCSLGCQDIWGSLDDLKKCLAGAGVDFKAPRVVCTHNSRTFQMNAELSKLAEQFVHARTMFEAMGIDGYFDIDKFDSDRPAFLHDLNEPLPDEFADRFGLVFDGGTVEHIFDVPRVLENIVKLVRPNGCVVHLSSFSIDHGFYAFSPLFYFDYYSANGFGEFECYLMEVDFSNITRTHSHRHRFVEYKYGIELNGVIDTSKEILIFFAARKLEGLPRPLIPTQGAYARRGYLRQGAVEAQPTAFERVIPRSVQPLLRPLRPLLRAAYRRYRLHQRRKMTKCGYI